MKKKFLSILLAALIAAFLHAPAFSASPAEITVRVRNQTGGIVTLSLTLAGVPPIYKTLESGVTSFNIPEGVYDFYASTPCGNQAGQWNININKTLFLTCHSGSPAISLTKIFTGCDIGVFEFAASSPDEKYFYSWNMWKDFLTEETLYHFGAHVNNAQETADEWNAHASLEYTAGCYDGLASYRILH
jgi:hypothetical protein